MSMSFEGQRDYFFRTSDRAFSQGPVLMRLASFLLRFLCWSLAFGLASSTQALAAQQSAEIPAWLRSHIGDGDGQIAPVVLERARALYLRKVKQGVVKNSCYFAMDATRPADLGNEVLGHRFYIICEANRSFRAISAGHGSGRDLKGIADFSNGRICARNFGNALDSRLTAGGAYVTAETKTSFKGYYQDPSQKDAFLLRTFVQYNGEGEAANARQRMIGGHAASLISNMCMQRKPDSPYADRKGLVPIGKLVEYPAGRSDGCTSWTSADAHDILPMIKNSPTTLYIYPESRDIDAVARSVAAGNAALPGGVYWDASCLKQIGAPKFWSKQMLEPALTKYKKDHPPGPPVPLPICPAS
jgi:hypothetical protein